MKTKATMSLFVILSIVVMTTTATNAFASESKSKSVTQAEHRFQLGFNDGCNNIVMSGTHSDAYNAGFRKGQSGDGCHGSGSSSSASASASASASDSGIGTDGNNQDQTGLGNPKCVQHCTSAIDQTQANKVPATGAETTPASATNPACKFICF